MTTSELVRNAGYARVELHRSAWFRPQVKRKGKYDFIDNFLNLLLLISRYLLLTYNLSNAFIDNHRVSTLNFEHKVRCLEKPRPTRVDVWLSRPGKQVAIEYKFTEPDFGTCSRTRLRPDKVNYSKQHCDGNYQVQRQRRNRCTLT